MPLKKRKYSLFMTFEDKLVRVREGAFVLKDARVYYQGSLLRGSQLGLNLTLRPVRDGYDGFNPEHKLVPSVNQAAKDTLRDILDGKSIIKPEGV